MKDLQPIWKDIFKANTEVLQQAAPLFLKELSHFEKALSKQSMFERILEQEKKERGEILLKKYSSELKDYFFTLNKQWIEEFFEMEETDYEVLTQPEKLLKEKGAEIYFAEYNGEIAGTFYLVPITKDTVEFSKFAVAPEYQKRGIGAFVLNAAIQRARKLGAGKLVLYTSPILISAMNLYTKHGFIFTENDRKDFYKRATVKMELRLG